MKAKGSVRGQNFKLVGQHSIFTIAEFEKKLIPFYKQLFARLPRQVKNTGSVTRYVGFQAKLSRVKILIFLGIEVECIGRIPEGMVAWELTENEWQVWQSREAVDILLSRQKIEWLWQEFASDLKKRIAGEFNAQVLPVSVAPEIAGPVSFTLTANAYVDKTRLEDFDDSISLVDYDPSWPKQFELTAEWLTGLLGSDIALRIEHFGSTAIPGMPAKPIIDVLIEIPSFIIAKQRVIPLFNNELWEYWWFTDHIFILKRNAPMGQRVLHIHMAPAGHKIWEGMTFRDILRTNSEEARCYASLKKKLAAELGHDREAYTQAKTDFVNEILSKISY